MNARSAFIIFTVTTTLLSTTIFSSLARAQSISGQGIAVKRSKSFDDVYEAVTRASATINQIDRFSAVCGDQDSSDQVEWSTSDFGVMTAIFTCVDFFGSGKIDEGTSFTFALDPQDGSLILAKQFDFKREPASKGRTRIIMAETAAFVASTALAVTAAARVFPDEPDKKLHAGTSAGIAAALTSLAYHYFGLSKNQSMVAGSAGSCTLGLMKEGADPYFGGNRNRSDMKANLIGCALGALGMRIALEFD